ncbi:unnamed protein product [Ectocarpus fasciculatus]
MSPAAETGSHIFMSLPQAGSGKRPAPQWAPGHAPAIAMTAVGIPPGSGATLSERDRRLAARHEERRQRSLHGPQEGPAEKIFQEREQERQAFEREAAASKRSVNVERAGSTRNEEGHPRSHGHQTSSTLRAAVPISAGGGASLTSALDQQVAEKSSREAKYEAKRRQYLAAQRGSSSGEPRVRFQGNQAKEPSVMSGHSPTLVASTIREVQQSASDQPPNVDPRELPNATSPGANIHRKAGIDEPSGRVELARFPQEAKRAPSSGPLRLPEQENLPHGQPDPTMVGLTHPEADYARHLREQMIADTRAAQRGTDDGRHPAAVAASTTPAHRGQRLPHAQPVVTGDSAATMSSTIDRKAEYASQLREQMAADLATRKDMEAERKSKVSTISSAVGPAIGGHEKGLRGGESEWVNESERQAKAEYAQQLREQMAAKEKAKRAAKGEMENSRSTNAGPSWIEGATEGREARRRRSNTEYAEQLRAQIAAQKSINQAQQSQGGNEKYFQQHHQQLLGGVNSFDYQSGEPERHRQIDDHRSQGRPRTEEKRVLSRGEVDNPLATARQERVNHQREYAEALRRDMATPKVDSLGRPIGDITSPSRTRLRNSNSGTRNTNNNPEFFGQNNRNSAPREARNLQPGPRPQAGEDARGWNQQPSEREYLREYATPYGILPPSQAQSQRRYEGGEHQHSRQPPLPGNHYDAYGSNPKGYPSRGGYDELEYPTGRQGNPRWVADGSPTSGLPPPRRDFGDNGERRAERWGTSGSYPERGGGYPGNRSRLPEFRGNNARQESWDITNPAVGREYNRDVHPGPIWDHREQQEHRYSGPRGPPSGAPAVGGGGGVRSTKASTMHNPVDPDELARIQAKKESYRRDLEAQMAEHTKLQDQRQQGVPGSKEAEVFHLQQAMEERNERDKMAPGYEIGPLGVPVIKDNYSTTGRGQRSPAKMRAVAPAAAVSRGLAATSAIDLPSRPAGESAPQANSDLFGSGHDGPSSSLLPTSEGGAGVGDAEGVGAPSRRGSGLRELLGIETHAERDREKSRVQAEALKKQVEDNKVRRDIQKAQLELHERREELRLQKEREQLHERYEQEGKLAKALEAEKLLKEAEEARLAHAARKEKAAAESREEEKREDARVEREQKELERKYARERAAEEPLAQASSNPANLPVSEFPTKKGGGTRSPRPIKSPREVEVNERRHEDSAMMPHLPGRERGARSIKAQSDNGEHMAEPSNIRAESPVQRDASSPHQTPRGLATRREGVSIEKLRTELWKQKQLTEVLRHEVGQQEAEKRKLIDIARFAKESEAAALRAAYERRASKHPPTKKLEIAGSAAEGNELWRVPPPPSTEGVEGEGCTPSPSDRRRAENNGAAKNAFVANRNFDVDETAEDRLLLAGLRRLSDGNRAPEGGCDTDRFRKDDLGGDSTFRERVPGARAWSTGAASHSGDGHDANGRSLDYGAVSPGGIRAESRYVFPDGSVRRRLETPGAAGGAGDGGGGGGVAMPLVGTSRIASADLSLALGIDSLRGGGGGAAGDDVDKASGRRRGTGRTGSRDNEGGEHRDLGAAPGAEWVPVGRPPRAFVPFLNLPASNGKANGNNSIERRRASRGSDGGDSPSFLPPVYSAAANGRSKGRGRPLAGIGGVLVSPGRAMLTGPGRPGTGATSPDGEMDSGHNRRRQLRRRARREGTDLGNTSIGDDECSDDCDSVGSGSTDVEFLRRRAEAKLKSLDRQEAADKAKAEEELSLLVASSPARGTTGAAMPEAPAMHSRAVGGVRVAAPIHNTARRTISAASSSSSRSLMYSRRKKRPGTNKSESSMLGDSRWAEQLG